MKHFVVHRREFLEKHLQDRGVTDVEWVTDLNSDSKLESSMTYPSALQHSTDGTFYLYALYKHKKH
jgi:hypothetical protein